MSAESQEEQKVEKEQKKTPKSGNCLFYIHHKHRFCKFQTIHNGTLCGFHSQAPNRIPCPFDPNHSIDTIALKNHLTKCPSRPLDVLPDWYEFNYNYNYHSPHECRQQSGTAITTTDNCNAHGDAFDLKNVGPGKVLQVIALAKEIIKELIVLEDIKTDYSMNDRIQGLTQTKHAQQQASLIGLLRDRNLLYTSGLFIEWGAGRAELSRYINKAICSTSSQGVGGSSSGSEGRDIHTTSKDNKCKHAFLLVDRDGGRLKHDGKMIDDCIQYGITYTTELVIREKVDIAHIRDLDALVSAKFPTELEQQHDDSLSICSVSKHLCGAATDLALTCLLNSVSKGLHRHNGFVLALCCYHRCKWSALLPASKDFLQRKGIDKEEFEILKSLASWYTSGIRPGMDPDSSGTHWSGFTHTEREKIGWICKRTIDSARIEAVKSVLGIDFSVTLVRYIEDSVSKECVAMVASRVKEDHDPEEPMVVSQSGATAVIPNI